jgi:hypothetical protein
LLKQPVKRVYIFFLRRVILMNRIEILTQEASFFGNKNNTYLLEIRWQGLVGPAATDWKKEYLRHLSIADAARIIYMKRKQTLSPTVLGSRKKNALFLALFLSAQKRLISGSILPSTSLIQKGAFSGLSMRNRGILEKEPGQSQSDREQRPQRGPVCSRRAAQLPK